MGNSGLLVDSGYFFALCTEGDTDHASAKSVQGLLDSLPVVLPWPVLYETMNTRFVKRLGVLAGFDALVGRPNTLLLDDSTYRERSYRTVVGTHGGRPFSLVDAVLRAVIEDPNVAISAMLTFDPGDFHDVCRNHRVALPCQNRTRSLPRQR